jgi:hypothetical protein
LFGIQEDEEDEETESEEAQGRNPKQARAGASARRALEAKLRLVQEQSKATKKTVASNKKRKTPEPSMEPVSPTKKKKTNTKDTPEPVEATKKSSTKKAHHLIPYKKEGKDSL